MPFPCCSPPRRVPNAGHRLRTDSRRRLRHARGDPPLWTCVPLEAGMETKHSQFRI
jgi:hypothetical protein